MLVFGRILSPIRAHPYPPLPTSTALFFSTGKKTLQSAYFWPISVDIMHLEATLSHGIAFHVSIVIVLKHLRHRLHSSFFLNLVNRNAWAGHPAKLGNVY